ncbi:MAG: DUF4468 domain-containing protein [Bacteroidales bacterium]|jgi:hypothetical protein|nr:DUF4468 domain-containing protein [Bacteroidales bacterium]
MKRITFLIIVTLILVANNILAQDSPTLPIDEKTGKIVYSEVVNVDSTSISELYLRAKTWFVHNFNSANNVIQLDDKELGKIIGKGLFDVRLSAMSKQSAGYVRFLVDIQVKEGRYKYTFTDFRHEPGTTNIVTPGDLTLKEPGGGLMTMGAKNWNGIKSQTISTVTSMIENLKLAMKGNSEAKDEW